jgi:hypothetical protein
MMSMALVCAVSGVLLLACGGRSSSAPEADAGGRDDAARDAGDESPPDDRVCKTTESVNDDDWIEAKNEKCCGGGLVFTEIAIISDAGSCFEPAPPSVMLCTRCGDGVCKFPENRCNCAKDCP